MTNVTPLGINSPDLSDEAFVDTFDLVNIYQKSRQTISTWIRKGILPPPLDNLGKGGSYRWMVKQIRDFTRYRAEMLTKRAIADLEKNDKIRIETGRNGMRGEFDLA